MNLSFLQWPVRKQLAEETNTLNRARIMVLSYALHLKLLTTAMLLASYTMHDYDSEAIRVAVLMVIAVLFYIAVSLGCSWRKAIHAAILIFMLIVWTNLLSFSNGLHLVTLQYMVIISLCSFYGLGNFWGLIYSFGTVLPFVIYLLTGHTIGSGIPWGPPGAGHFAIAILLFHNFVFLVLINYYFFNSYQKTIRELDARTMALTASLSSLEEARESQEQEIAHQQHLLASISHDIKSPLRFLMTTTARLARNYPDLPTVRAISQSSSRLYNFMKNLLEYTELRYKENGMNFTYMDVNELVSEKLAIFATEAESNSNVLVNHVPPGVILKNNPQLIGIILHNLIDNANKVTQGGTVTVSCEDLRNELLLNVSDTGAGMDRRIMNWVNSDVKLPGSEHNAQSFGMGLLIIKELTRLVHARLVAKPNSPAGTSVHIIFSKNSTN
ncbi:HAMP domain-containing sensor histidine kinase [Dyadobacter sp. CY323]|uniref:sensor histidine kinase n=1 Tax=Dyadobacter sp. CY323 TaxID=2907302 RepID=UPI001F3E4AF5|nr:HAMP domain-containing sensor histidine kinase [Dyadobacter sp. CY323]MCE6987538.1 HAMP domain-containing histidine kinase [Dyadobacter sp. CY323]